MYEDLISKPLGDRHNYLSSLESGKIKWQMELLLMRVVKRPRRDQEDIYIKCSVIGQATLSLSTSANRENLGDFSLIWILISLLIFLLLQTLKTHHFFPNVY
jgi:hypothetical protein